jgi:hypothetical protein
MMWENDSLTSKGPGEPRMKGANNLAKQKKRNGEDMRSLISITRTL